MQLDQLAYLDLDGSTWIVEPGPIDVLVGSASDDIRAHARFEVTGPKVTVGRSRSLSLGVAPPIDLPLSFRDLRAVAVSRRKPRPRVRRAYIARERVVANDADGIRPDRSGAKKAGAFGAHCIIEMATETSGRDASSARFAARR